MISNEELVKYLLENRVDEDGDLMLAELDFSNFDGNVYISTMKVKGDLHQEYQQVGGSLHQYEQDVKRRFYDQKLSESEEYRETIFSYTMIAKKKKELTVSQLEAILGYEIKIVEE